MHARLRTCPHRRSQWLRFYVVLNINENLAMDSEKLVEAVRRWPILYQSSSKAYKDAEKKAAAWRDVAAELGFTGTLNHIVQ